MPITRIEKTENHAEVSFLSSDIAWDLLSRLGRGRSRS